MFVDRDRELAFLERAWASQRAELLVVYGRRRVGKTALLRQFCLGRSHTFWVASLSSEALLRQSFTQALWQSTHPDRPDPGFTYATWQRAFEALADVATDQRHLVVLDEFPYLAHTEASVPSVLQQVWDERLQHTRLVRSCTCPMRINIAGSPVDRHRGQKGLDERTLMASQRPSPPW